MAYRAATSYACDAATPKRARAWTLDRISAVLPRVPHTAEVLDDAALVVSELVTNALIAGSSEVTISVAVEGQLLHISVADDAPGVPRMRMAAPEDQHGRGLPIVAAVSQTWGVAPLPAGKRVWVKLAIGTA